MGSDTYTFNYRIQVEADSLEEAKEKVVDELREKAIRQSEEEIRENLDPLPICKTFKL